MSISGLTRLQEEELAEVLTAFGLNQKDRQVYLELLQAGQVTVTPLSRATKLPVTTTQSVLERLVDVGLVGVPGKKTRRAYEAHDPRVFTKLLEQQLQEVQTILPLLAKLRGDSGAAPKLKLYYRERMADIFHEALAAKSKHVYEIVSARDIQDVLGERFHFSRRRIQHKVRLKSLRVEKWEIKKYSKQKHVREYREAKFLPREITFRANVMFWDDTVAFFTTKREGLAWTVESPSVREMIEQIFELLWSVSRRMET